MGLFKLFSGKSPEDIENQGDDLFDKGVFGPAKLEYEKALAKFEKKHAAQGAFGGRIREKIVRAKEALARQHVESAAELMAADCLDEARELLDLAMELSFDDEVKSEVSGLMDRLSTQVSEKATIEDVDGAGDFFGDDEEDSLAWDEEDPEDVIEEEEYFNALISVLPPDEQAAYATYGRSFVIGYIALNQGQFDVAKENLSIALQENSNEKTYIPLELATCCLNLEEYGEAKALLYDFMTEFPHSLRACQVICETLWAEENFDEALDVLARYPGEILNTPEMTILRGETLVQTGKLKDAETCYLDYLSLNDRDDLVLRALAGVYEATGETATANALYGELLNACTGCGRRADVHLKRRFADTAFALGEKSVKVLEMYLDLAGEDPFNRGPYYARVAAIYRELGNETEAIRFQGFSEKEGRTDA